MLHVYSAANRCYVIGKTMQTVSLTRGQPSWPMFESLLARCIRCVNGVNAQGLSEPNKMVYFYATGSSCFLARIWGSIFSNEEYFSSPKRCPGCRGGKNLLYRPLCYSGSFHFPLPQSMFIGSPFETSMPLWVGASLRLMLSTSTSVSPIRLVCILALWQPGQLCTTS